MQKIIFRAMAGARTMAGAMALVALTGCGAYAQSHQEPFIQKSLAGQAISQVTAETSGGNITVAGAHDADARLEIYVWVSNQRDRDEGLSKEEIQKRLNEQYDLTVDVADHKLTVIAKAKTHFMNWGRGISISYKIYVPSNVTTRLRTSGGNIAMKDLNGAQQDFRTSGGNLDLARLGGRIKGSTSGGNISIDDAKDDIDLSTSGGNIDARHCKGTIRLSTSGGNLELTGLSGTIHATTSGGNVSGGEVEGELNTHTSGGNVDLQDLSCSLETSTSGGEISVSMRQLGKFLIIGNSSGDISLSLPGDKGVDLKVYGSRIKTSGMGNFKGETDEKRLEGSMNGGGIPVKIDGGSGRVSLAFK
ncbi:MAG: DUF4097 family beta strand repeat-containing protein [Bacteroidota bacterium]|nr:DUF4097 family beta strand repeat-containing protein [Bacteroidota bacterium]